MQDRTEGRLESQTGVSSEEGERILEGRELFEKRFQQALIWALRCTGAVHPTWSVEPGGEAAFLAEMVESEVFFAITVAFERIWEEAPDARSERFPWEGMNEVSRQLFLLSFTPVMVYEYRRLVEEGNEIRSSHWAADRRYRLSKEVCSKAIRAIRGVSASRGCSIYIEVALNLVQKQVMLTADSSSMVNHDHPYYYSLGVLPVSLPREVAWLEGCLYRHPHDRDDASPRDNYLKLDEFTPAHMLATAAWLLPMIQMRGCVAKGVDQYIDRDGGALLAFFERRYDIDSTNFESEVLEAQAEGERLFQKDLARYKELAEGYKKDWRLLKKIDQRSAELTQELSKLDAQIQHSNAAILAYEHFINDDIAALDQMDAARYPVYEDLLSMNERPFRGSVEEVVARHRFELLTSLPERRRESIKSNSLILNDLLRKRALLIDRHNHWSTIRKDSAKKELAALDEQIENTRSMMNADLDEKRESYMYTWREAELAEENLPFYTAQRTMTQEAFENAEELKTELRVRLQVRRKTLNEFLDRAGYALIPAALDLSQPLSPTLELVRPSPPSWNGYD